jgi:hypothetical protein
MKPHIRVPAEHMHGPGYHLVPIEKMEEYEDIIEDIVGPTCDECRTTYEPPIYYSLGDGDDSEKADHVCTRNLCPECAGPDLDPDDPTDPRRPTMR